MASPALPESLRTVDQIVRKFVGLDSRAHRDTRSNHLHIIDVDGMTWWSNAAWMANLAYYPVLQTLQKKYDLGQPGRYEFEYYGGRWNLRSLGEAATQLQSYARGALENARKSMHLEARRRTEQYGPEVKHTAFVELQHENGHRMWPMVDQDNEYLGMLGGNYAEALESSALANFVNYKGDHVIHQGWRRPIEVPGTGMFVFPHWHALSVTYQHPLDEAKPITKVLDSFLTEIRPHSTTVRP